MAVSESGSYIVIRQLMMYLQLQRRFNGRAEVGEVRRGLARSLRSTRSKRPTSFCHLNVFKGQASRYSATAV